MREASWIRAIDLVGHVHIGSALPLDEIVRCLSSALVLSFSKSDQFDEFDGFVAASAGLSFKLIDTRDGSNKYLQLTVSSQNWAEEIQGHSVELSALYTELIRVRTGYECISGEAPNTSPST